MLRLARDRRGVAAVEFALIAPLLLFMLTGVVDVMYLARGHLRVQAAATQIGQIVSQCPSFGGGDQAQITGLANRALGPFSQAGKPWAVLVTAIRLNGQGQPSVLWTMGNRTAAMTGFVTDGAAMPPGFTLQADRVLFRTEVFAQVDARLASTVITGVGSLVGLASRVDTATSSILHVSRSPDANRLNNSTGGACL